MEPKPAHLKDRLPRRIPNTNVFDVASHQRLSATLLPLDDEPRVVLLGGGGERLRNALEGRDEANIAR